MYPDRLIQMGIAEQNMAGVAAGLARMGKRPYYVTYSAFGVGRAFDQLRVTVGYTGLPVVIGGGHSGISVGPDGATHQMLEDLALVRSLPGFTVLVPADYEQTVKAVSAAHNLDGPVYIRFGREAVPDVTCEDDTFEVGKAQVMAEGNDLTCIAIGHMVSEALLAHDELAKHGIGLRVLNMHTVKPLDEDAIVKAARQTGGIVVAEEHQIHGGLGDAVAQIVSREEPVPMQFVAVMDRYGQSGQPDELLDAFGLRARDIVAKAQRVLLLKKAELS
jgi:transketolase